MRRAAKLQPGGAGPGKVLFLYMAISLLFNRYCIVSFKFPPRRPSPQAPNRFLVQSLARFGLQNGFWCNPRRVLRYPCRGATAYTPQTSRQGRVPDIFIRPYGGRLMGANAIRPYTRVPGQIRRRPKTPPAKFAGARRPPASYHPHAKGRPGVRSIDVDIRFHFRLIRYAVRRMTPRELIVSSSRFILPMPLSICSRRRQ